MRGMRRRTLLQAIITTLPALSFSRVRLHAQLRTLTPEAIATLQEVAATVLPASLGADKISLTVDRFVAWTKGYQENIPLQHGYGHPRLVKTAASPVPDYVAQLASIAATAGSRGGPFGSLPLDARRAIVDQALTAANVTQLPSRPGGGHVISDLMAFYFRSSEANDVAHRARIGRQVCRPIELTTRRPTTTA
jgi:hypothetical protein